MIRVCINCTYPLVNSKSDFCSWNCSQEYDNMEHIQHTEERKIMAVTKEVVVTFTDDLTKEEFAEGTGETVTYELDGKRYEIDLTTKNATAFRKAFEKYVKVSREKASRGRKPGSQANPEVTVMREWARSHGYEVNDRGRIPEHIVKAYNAQK